MRTTSELKPQIKVCSLSLLIGRNRILVLNIFKFLAYRRKALSMIGMLSKKYSSFVKQDMALFEILEKEKRQNHVGSDQEYAEFLHECTGATKDFSIDLYLRARYLPRFLQQCGKVRIKDLYIIFDSLSATQQAARAIGQNLAQNRILG